MNIIVNQLLSTHTTLGLPVEQVAYLLQNVATNLPIDVACVYEYHPETGHLHLLVHHGVTDLVETTRETINRIFEDFADHALVNHAPKLLGADELSGTPFQSALLFPFVVDAQVRVVLALCSMDGDAYTLTQADHPLLHVIRTLLENHYTVSRLAQDYATAESILKTARAIADNPSPQHVVNLLRETLFDPHISTCAMLIYGPQRGDSPFEYLEIRGTWSRRLNEFGIATGIKLYLKDYPELLATLEKRGVVTVKVRSKLDRFDPLTRSLLRAERVRALSLVALGTGAHKLGVLALGTDKPHDFTAHELDNYRTVGEFLAISAMAQVLRSQRDRVEQARSAMTEAVTDGVLMVLPGGAGGHVLTVNNRFLTLFGMLEADATGISLLDLLNEMQVPEGVRADLRHEWQSTPVHDPAIHRGEFSMVHTEGYPIDTEWYSAPVYQDKTVLGRIYIFHDVTPERTAQRLRAKFLSGISHELRTPLTAIRGFAEFILEATGDQLPDLAREYTEIILNSSKHLNRVFNDMIEITRADAGEMKLNKSDIHLPDVIIDVVARLQLQYKAKKQKVIMDLDDDLPAVHADIDRMSQVVTNLLTNAIKYSPEKGNIFLSTRLIRETSELPEAAPHDLHLPAVLVTVRDEGKGLNHEEAEKVFMPFFRTEDAKRAKIEGVGLGLAVTRSIVEVHRGKIWTVPTAKEAGGVFMFTIPTAR